MKDLSVEGNGHLTAGRDLRIEISGGNNSNKFSSEFESLDLSVKNIIGEDRVLKGQKHIVYSSEKLFSSLIKIGLPADVSMKILEDIIPILNERFLNQENSSVITTSDIRFAVAECIGGVVFEGHAQSEVDIWRSAYFRRYGNPDNDCIYIIDGSEEKPLNFSYIETKIIPHILKRSLGLGRFNNPVNDFPKIFTKSVIENMSREILFTANNLNAYALRYKTLLNLVEDIITSSPHPWLVNSETQQSIVNYNYERMMFHFDKSVNHQGTLIKKRHLTEFFMHSCATILSLYGAFLGVGTKYGLAELLRMLEKMRRENINLWVFCGLNNLEHDLKEIGINANEFYKFLKSISIKLNNPNASSISILEIGRKSNDVVEIVKKLKILTCSLTKA